jgi:hypothetical protein
MLMTTTMWARRLQLLRRRRRLQWRVGSKATRAAAPT